MRAALNSALRHLPRWVVWGLGAVPLVALIGQAVTGALGVDPVKKIEHALGLHALQFLLAALALSLVLRGTGVNLIRYRRALGVWAFVYAALHFTVWLVLDIQLRWPEIARDLTKRPYIIAGMIGFVAMLPLVLTSVDSAVRRLGAARWRRLHLLAYPAAIAGGVHFLLSVKSWPPEPLIYAALILGLVVARAARAWKTGETAKNASSMKKPLAAAARRD